MVGAQWEKGLTACVGAVLPRRATAAWTSLWDAAAEKGGAEACVRCVTTEGRLGPRLT